MKQVLINTHHFDFAYCANSRIKTVNANRYLNRLCKHFKHKVTVNLEASRGYIDFSIGVCEINVDDTLLIFYCGSDNKDDLNDIIETIDRHLKQFSHSSNSSYKEPLSLQWHFNE